LMYIVGSHTIATLKIIFCKRKYARLSSA